MTGWDWRSYTRRLARRLVLRERRREGGVLISADNDAPYWGCMVYGRGTQAVISTSGSSTRQLTGAEKKQKCDVKKIRESVSSHQAYTWQFLSNTYISERLVIQEQ